MQTAIDFVDFLLGFVPFALMVAIALFVFWIAAKLIPSLNEWMTSTDGTVDAEYEDREYEHRYGRRSIDQYM